jgi:hypothetical protein
MPWKRNDPDPLAARRRQLAEQERLLAEQSERLREQLQGAGDGASDPIKRAEPPVWRMEEDGRHERKTDPAPARRRNLARQRQRDMILVFGLIVLLCIILGIVLWVAHVHDSSPINGA